MATLTGELERFTTQQISDQISNIGINVAGQIGNISTQHGGRSVSITGASNVQVTLKPNVETGYPGLAGMFYYLMLFKPTKSYVLLYTGIRYLTEMIDANVNKGGGERKIMIYI